MQLDKTHVVIRLRSMSEIGDLALVMLRRYPAALLIGFFAGAAPWAILDLGIMAWHPVEEMSYGFEDSETTWEMYRYLAWMTLLVIVQAPAAGVATTIYLGQAVFEHQPTWKSVFVEVRRQFWRWFWVLGIKRLALPATIVPLVRMFAPLDVFWDVVVPVVIFFAVVIIRNAKPFAPEILLLEQCPIRAAKSAAITYSRRSKSLHSPISGELSGRFLAISFMMFWLCLSTVYTFVFLRGIASGQWNWDLFAYLVMVPAALWFVAGISVIVRLLCYLDARIRLEGWEVELAIRAEAIRQFGEDQPLRHDVRASKPATARTPLAKLDPLTQSPAKNSAKTSEVLAASLVTDEIDEVLK